MAAAFYPRRLGGVAIGSGDEDGFVAERLAHGLATLREEIAAELDYWEAESDQSFDADHAQTILRLFTATLTDVRAAVDRDIEAAFLGDPAARSVDEVLVTYPSASALLPYRLAHELDQLGAPIVARMITERAHQRTGIFIHPGATIGRSCFIDYGTGVVIGETAMLGDRVRLYQNVTLGARVPLGAAPAAPHQRFRRHPIIEDDVVIHAGATILGPVTIGKGAIIGGNLWVLDDVPAEAVLQQAPALQPDPAVLADIASSLSGRHSS